jgi:transcriptional regulator with XRE-family HTH domain
MEESEQTDPARQTVTVTPASPAVGCTDFDIGCALQSERERQGITTTELAERVATRPSANNPKGHISQAQVSRLFAGKQGWRSSTLRAFAKALNIDLVATYR